MSEVNITLSKEDLDLLIVCVRQAIQTFTPSSPGVEAKVQLFIKLARRRIAGDYTPSLYDPCLVHGGDVE